MALNSQTTKTTSKPKTIRPPGSNTSRVSVACDRCRKKKIRCFYDDDDKEHKPGEKRQCANCKVVGLECIFTDKLARKAFPRGYTESLEERVRELEFENKKLQKLLSLKTSSSGSGAQVASPGSIDSVMDDNPSSGKSSGTPKSNSQSPLNVPLNKENLTRFNQQHKKEVRSPNSRTKKTLGCGHLGHLHDDSCNCGYAHSIHDRPVSVAGSVDIDHGELSDDNISLYSVGASESASYTAGADDLRRRYGFNSFEQVNAPGAAAAISLQNKLRTKNFMNLANLIAASIPRSTEETLFIPTLLAKIVNVHGFNSKAPYLTARSIALLKELPNDGDKFNQYPVTFKGVNFHGLKREESIQFFRTLNLPNYLNLDLCVSVYFDTWNTIVPIFNKEIFMNNYIKFGKSRGKNFEDGGMVGFEKFGELLVIITALVLLSHERNNSFKSRNKKESSNTEVLQFYDHMIKQFITSNITSICSISSLQMVTIELLYCLTTGDLNTSYELRGRMVTMSQQLRLQRCPAAVLGYNGSNVSKLQQGERRILFWCSYSLDAFSAFILGVPRLFKDYEIECALPSSSSSDKENKDSDINMITFNNIKLSLVGKVCDSALSVMRYSRILGTIVDNIFKRNDNNLKKPSIDESACFVMENMLDSWRKTIPPTVSFNRLDVDGNFSDYDKMNNTQLTLLYLYYQAKALIYMPLMASESQNNKSSPAFISIQQATTAILTITKALSSPGHDFYYLPLPMNLPRQKARFVLLAAKSALEFTRGGALFQEAKSLITSAIQDLKDESEIKMLGCLSSDCCTCLERAVDAIFSQPHPIPLSPSPPPRLITDISKYKGITSPLRNVATANTYSEGNNQITATINVDSAVPIRSNSVNGVEGRHHLNLSHERRFSDSINGNTSSSVKTEPDSATALNDIFTNKVGYQIQTLQQQMRQPFQPIPPGMQYQRNSLRNQSTSPHSASNNSNTSSTGSFTQGYNTGVQGSQTTPDWNSNSGSSYKKLEEQQLNQNLHGLQFPGNQDMLHIFNVTQQQEVKSLNDMLQQVNIDHVHNNSEMSSASILERPQANLSGTDTQKHKETTQATDHPSSFAPGNGKSYSDLLMLNDFGVDASIGVPFDFELDGQNKRARLEVGSNKEQPDANSANNNGYPSYNNLFDWH